MDSSPNPTPLESRFSADGDADHHRNTFCPNYSRCLDVSLDCGWSNWTCTRCALFKLGNRADLRAHANSRRIDPFGQ
jgi:hypothetical protein